ncbi:MAG: recombinase zinc beta ribbon domain-containing protein [candidate division NC10 bacterium]|nr:recombinase zinc beta ribbon domain-containing protein [candidate division NC10 bacterium]
MRIIDPELWQAVQARLKLLEERFRCGGERRPQGGARVAYSPHLLSGLLRCGVCGARMIAQTATRKKGDTVYRYGWYRCGFAAHKGTSVCGHTTGYRQDRLERVVLAKFREAMSPEVVHALVRTVNEQIEGILMGRGAQVESIKAEILRLEREAGNLVRFLAEGSDSPTVRAELRRIEEVLEPLRGRLLELEQSPPLRSPKVHPAWVWAKLERLDELLRQDPAQGKAEIAKHLDGDLTISPLPSPAGERRAEISGRIKQNSLLMEQEAVCLQLVAGAGFEPATFGL